VAERKWRPVTAAGEEGQCSKSVAVLHQWDRRGANPQVITETLLGRGFCARRS